MYTPPKHLSEVKLSQKGYLNKNNVICWDKESINYWLPKYLNLKGVTKSVFSFIFKRYIYYLVLFLTDSSLF